MKQYKYEDSGGGRYSIYELGYNMRSVATCYDVVIAQKIVDALNEAEARNAPQR